MGNGEWAIVPRPFDCKFFLLFHLFILILMNVKQNFVDVRHHSRHAVHENTPDLGVFLFWISSRTRRACKRTQYGCVLCSASKLYVLLLFHLSYLLTTYSQVPSTLENERICSFSRATALCHHHPHYTSQLVTAYLPHPSDIVFIGFRHNRTRKFDSILLQHFSTSTIAFLKSHTRHA